MTNSPFPPYLHTPRTCLEIWGPGLECGGNKNTGERAKREKGIRKGGRRDRGMGRSRGGKGRKGAVVGGRTWCGKYSRETPTPPLHSSPTLPRPLYIGDISILFFPFLLGPPSNPLTLPLLPSSFRNFLPGDGNSVGMHAVPGPRNVCGDFRLGISTAREQRDSISGFGGLGSLGKREMRRRDRGGGKKIWDMGVVDVVLDIRN